ncbi:MAG: hypothetical protein LBR07_06980, partial [Puniceicoccales bacterium]|nr:hypothetical protein [Puniceicoccales bacterium]
MKKARPPASGETSGAQGNLATGGGGVACFGTMLSFDGIHLRYGHQLLFDDISAAVGSRERIGLAGRNGSG